MGSRSSGSGSSGSGSSGQASGSGYNGSGITIAVLDSESRDIPTRKSAVCVGGPGGAIANSLTRTGLAVRDFVGVSRPADRLMGSRDPRGRIGPGAAAAPVAVYRGAAPRSSLVSVRVLDSNGAGKTSTVIAGLEWVVQNKARYNIRVVTLSLGHPIFDSAAKDPLVQAVERAWQAGLVVVVSAGNHGRDGFFTVTSPGNSSRAITVGSITEWNTPTTGDDTISSFSSRGPRCATIREARPRRARQRIVALRARNSGLDMTYPERRVRIDGARMRNTRDVGDEHGRALVAGAAALMLQRDPT